MDLLQLKDNISTEDRKKIEDKCTAEKEEFEHQQKELEALCNPIIIIRMYQSADGMPGSL